VKKKSQSNEIQNDLTGFDAEHGLTHSSLIETFFELSNFKRKPFFFHSWWVWE